MHAKGQALKPLQPAKPGSEQAGRRRDSTEQKPNRGGNSREHGEIRQQNAEAKASGDGASDGGAVFDAEENDGVKQVHGGTS
jgi:hypothetical protein